MSKSKTEINLPSLMGIPEFPSPTAAQMRFAIAWLQPSYVGMPPYKVLSAIGLSDNLLYKWKTKPNFEKWLRVVGDEHHINYGLSEVNRAVKREALKNSAQDRKLYNELYNPDYRPRSALDINADAGRRPPDKKEAIKKSKAFIAEIDGQKPPKPMKKIDAKFLPNKTDGQGKDEPKLN